MIKVVKSSVKPGEVKPSNAALVVETDTSSELIIVNWKQQITAQVHSRQNMQYILEFRSLK